jgi:hypothetical protein
MDDMIAEPEGNPAAAALATFRSPPVCSCGAWQTSGWEWLLVGLLGRAKSDSSLVTTPRLDVQIEFSPDADRKPGFTRLQEDEGRAPIGGVSKKGEWSERRNALKRDISPNALSTQMGSSGPRALLAMAGSVGVRTTRARRAGYDEARIQR